MLAAVATRIPVNPRLGINIGTILAIAVTGTIGVPAGHLYTERALSRGTQAAGLTVMSRFPV